LAAPSTAREMGRSLARTCSLLLFGVAVAACSDDGSGPLRRKSIGAADPQGTDPSSGDAAAPPASGAGAMPPGAGAAPGFGYPVGDKATNPAGGWTVAQVLGHYLNSGAFVGGHLAEDIASGKEATTAGAPVYAVADGTVLYAGTNASTYKNVVLLEHHLGDGTTVCSFYGHLGPPIVKTGDSVSRGDQLATVLDWAKTFGAPNSHLHYVILDEALCHASAAAHGALVCGYDNTPGPNGIQDLATEPATYTSAGDVCGDDKYKDAFLAPSKFIAAHHF
jgi:murein DD-endopeptidase MepM/ murein hydrolase activator NlpD